MQSYNLEEHNFENKIDKKEELNRKKEDILSKLRNMVNKNKESNYNK